MTPAVYGQYFIDKVGNLYVNWESRLGKQLYSTLKVECLAALCASNLVILFKYVSHFSMGEKFIETSGKC